MWLWCYSVLTALDVDGTGCVGTHAVEGAGDFLVEEVAVEILRPLRVIGVGVDVVVGKLLCVVAPESAHVFDFVELDAGVTLSQLSVLQLLRIVGNDWSEKQGQRRSDCCLAVDFGKHDDGVQRRRTAYSDRRKEISRDKETGTNERCTKEMERVVAVCDNSTMRGRDAASYTIPC